MRHSGLQRGAASGSLWCWGYNNDGQLGYDTDGNLSIPINSGTPEQVGSATNWTTVAGGGATTCAINSAGALYCWGDNTYGQLGNGTESQPITGTSTGPALVALPSGHTSSQWTAITLGNSHVCGLLADTSLWCWGEDDAAQLGNTANDTTLMINGTSHKLTETPVQVTNSASHGWSAVGAGGAHTCAIDITGSMWCWGLNNYAQLGNGTGGTGSTVGTETPTPVINPAGDTAAWQAVHGGIGVTGSSGGYHTCATKTDGTLWCWGQNTYEQLGFGIGGDSPATVPEEVGLSSTVVAFSAGEFFTCEVDSTGLIWCSGDNQYGELGNCTSNPSASPTQAD